MLNKAQQKVIDSNHNRILVLAGAGTGKTYVMIEKIKSIIDSGADPSSILALTFTNAAAFEMKDRFQKSNNKSTSPNFCTFHAFCYRLLASDVLIRNAIGYENVPQIVEDNELKRISREVKLECSIKLSDAMLNRSETDVPEISKYEYKLYHKRFKQKLSRENVITFDMLAEKVCKLFIEDDPLVNAYKQQYKYVFVDEFQDTDPLQWEFVKSFKESNMLVVGDALQAIYGFRNSDSTIIKELASNDEWEVIKLYENYRSTEPIIQFANEHSEYARGEYRIELQALRPGPEVATDIKDTRSSSMSNYSESTLEIVTGYCVSHKGTSAILVRTNREVSMIADYLTSKEIPYSIGKPDDSINILKGAGSTKYLVDWLASFLNADKYTDFLRIVSIYPTPPDGSEVNEDTWKLALLLDNFGKNRRIQELTNKVFTIRKILLDKDELPFAKCNKVLEVLGIADIVVNTNAFTSAELLSYLKEEIENRKNNELYVGTIHSSKGLEYDTVALLGVNGPSFHLYSEEDHNLYYVGITRARTNLMVVENEDVQ